MDPRHPELALKRVKELVKQYDKVEKDILQAPTSAALASAEREGVLVIQELCLVAPRLHEAMMQSSRSRRQEMARAAAAVAYQPVEGAAEPASTVSDEATPAAEPSKNNKKQTKKAKK